MAPALQCDYDVIGFELNNCLAKYNIIETTKLRVKVLLNELHDNNPKEYPKEILDFDYDRNIAVARSNCVWDIDYGILLTLANQYEITHAVLGF
jgi:hypothetical protein